VVVRDVDREAVEVLAERLSRELGRLPGQGHFDHKDVGHVGIAYHQGEGTASELLSRADMALRSAEGRGANAWALYDENVVARSSVHTAGEWLARLRDVIEHRRIILHFQPVRRRRDRSVLHCEVLARIPGADGETLPAGIFIPMAERHALGPAFDRAVIELVLEQLARHPEGPTLAVNLSPASVHDAEFGGWLAGRLQQAPEQARRMVLEATEYGVASDQDAVERFVRGVASTAAGFGLDHFGVGAASFGYLRRFRLAYIKVDGSYIRGIDGTADNQFLVQSVADIAHGLDIPVIAESVETEAEWNILDQLHVDAAQGYFVGRPGESIET